MSSYRIVSYALAALVGAGLWGNGPFGASRAVAGIRHTSDVSAAAGDEAWPSDFALLDQSVHVDPVRRVARFHLVFTRPPDFLHSDEFDRPDNSFQFEINPTFAGGPGELLRDGVGDVQTVVRGDELRYTGGKLLRIRTTRGDPDPDPAAGGWGEVRGAVPIHLSRNELDFAADFDTLKEDGDGRFAYRVFTTQHGETTSSLEAIAVPVPPAVWIGGSTLLMAIGAQFWWRRRIRRQMA
jgi:hypothetical protein